MSKQQQEEVWYFLRLLPRCTCTVPILQRYLQWLNSQLMLIGKPQVDNLSESLADASLLILALAVRS